MRNIIKAGLFWCGILLSFVCNAQYSPPLGALPMQFNGSFAGEAGVPRVSIIGSYYWHRAPSVVEWNSYHSDLSYDQFIPAIRSGVGLSVGGYKWESLWEPERQIEGESYYVALAVAPKISIKGKYTLSPSIIVRYDDGNSTSKESQVAATFRSKRVTSQFGLLWNTPKYYIGYSFNGFSHSELEGESLSNGIKTPVVNIKRPYRFNSLLQAGYTYQRSSESNFSITPQLVIRVIYPDRGSGESLFRSYVEAYNLNFRYKKFIWGVNNAGVHVGLQTERLRLMMTNDNGYFTERYNRSFSSESKSYHGNLSLRYLFKDPSRKFGGM